MRVLPLLLLAGGAIGGFRGDSLGNVSTKPANVVKPRASIGFAMSRRKKVARGDAGLALRPDHLSTECEILAGLRQLDRH
jgi:hypothetical protein